jgi:hypothetical protein
MMMVVSGSGVALAQPAPPPAGPAAPDPATAAPPAPVPSAPGVAAAAPGTTAPSTGDRAAQAPVVPGFVVIDPIDASSQVGIQLGYVGLKGGSPSTSTPTLLRLEGRARYVDRRTGLGGYVDVPFAYARDSSNGQSATITDVGDLEIGGIFAPGLGLPDFGLVVHAGIALPTGEKGAEAAVGTVASVATLSGFYNALPRGTTIKLGVSPMFRSGIAFGRLDLGFDGNISADQASVGSGIHYNVGVGLDLGAAALMLESENLTILGEGNRDSTTVNAVAVSARVNAGAVSPHLALVIPVDDDERQIIDLAVIAGVDFKLP